MNRKAMTILEMLISAALVTIVLVTGAAVFSLAVKAQRNASATANTMDSFSTLSGTLERNFSQIITDAPIAVWFDKDGSSSISFFANGGFSGYSGYSKDFAGLSEEFLTYYGNPDYAISGDIARFTITADSESGFLLQLMNISDQYEYDGVNPYPLLRIGPFIIFDKDVLNNGSDYLYDSISILRWKSLLAGADNSRTYLDYVEEFNAHFAWHSSNTELSDWKNFRFPMLMTDGLASFSVQLGLGTESDRVSASNTNRITRWFPDDNPYTFHSGSDSDLDVMDDSFGVYFNMSDPTGDNTDNWYRPGDGGLKRAVLSGSSINDQEIEEGYVPVAIKLTYKFKAESVYASERVFTQIIYLN